MYQEGLTPFPQGCNLYIRVAKSFLATTRDGVVKLPDLSLETPGDLGMEHGPRKYGVFWPPSESSTFSRVDV